MNDWEKVDKSGSLKRIMITGGWIYAGWRLESTLPLVEEFFQQSSEDIGSEWKLANIVFVPENHELMSINEQRLRNGLEPLTKIR